MDINSKSPIEIIEIALKQALAAGLFNDFDTVGIVHDAISTVKAQLQNLEKLEQKELQTRGK